MCGIIGAYINKSNDLDVEIRFVIIAVYKEGKNHKIEHIEDAFYHF